MNYLKREELKTGWMKTSNEDAMQIATEVAEQIKKELPVLLPKGVVVNQEKLKPESLVLTLRNATPVWNRERQ